eukprot:TRINITY_DN19844_c0_g2_i2.p1 TRINITY_DN19844_c0_g2~~TRINITY_DN19844_c0_g2_i2.p1  ORF type:complete len:371 (+),score=84.75 TRINITY_DN19844_c0_g2_i2:436-1548(+)
MDSSAPEQPEQNQHQEPPPAPSPAGAAAEAQSGLKYSSYVPTRREIESGEYVVQEVVAVVRAEGVETSQLEPLEDWEAAVQDVSQNLFTRDWSSRFDILHSTRKLVKFDPSRVAVLVADIGKCLQECLKNPRSSILREACMLSGDLLTCTELTAVVTKDVAFDKLIPALLLKSISDKKFIRDQAVAALHSHARAVPHLYQVYHGSCEHKNSKIAASASHIVSICLELLCEDNSHQELLPDDAAEMACRMARVYLHGKLADTRKSGKRCLELLGAKLSPEVVHQQIAAGCTVSDTEAVRRLLYPEQQADQEPVNNTSSFKEFIQSASPASSPKSSGNPSEPVLVMETESTRARRNSTPRERKSSEDVLQLF